LGRRPRTFVSGITACPDGRRFAVAVPPIFRG
jgi:hypothetical protein